MSFLGTLFGYMFPGSGRLVSTLGGALSRAGGDKPRRLTSAAFGKALPIVWGRARVPGAIVFISDAYSANNVTGPDVVVALAEGPIETVSAIGGGKIGWFGNDANNDFVWDDWPISPWFTSNDGLELPSGLNIDAEKDIAYPGIGLYTNHEEFPQYLGSASYEILGKRAGTGDATTGDADPAYIVSDLVTDASFGAGAWFDVDVVNGLDGTAESGYRRYTKAEGLFLSPMLDEQQPAADHLSDVLDASNATVLWSDGQLKVIPLGNAAVTGNSVTYTPVNAVRYAFTRAHLVEPIEIDLPPESDTANIAPVEYLDRNPANTTDTANRYNRAIAESPDAADVGARGPVRASPAKLHSICVRDTALRISELRVQRMVRARMRVTFTVPWNYARLEPLDFVSVSDDVMGLSAMVVRIDRITEDESYNLTIEGTQWELDWSTGA